MRVAVVVGAVMFAVAACSLSTDEAPRDISAEQLSDLLQPTDAVPTDTTTVESNAVSLTVYLLDSENPLLQQRSRDVADTSAVTMLTELRRITDDDSSLGLRTLINDDYRVVGEIDVTGTTLTLPLSAGFYSLEGQNRALAAAQIVFTVTAIPDFDAVLFVNEEGTPQAIPDGELVVAEEPRPMTRADFSRFNPLDTDPEN